MTVADEVIRSYGDADARKLVDQAREMAPAVGAQAKRIEDDRRLPPELVKQFLDAGFFHALLPRDIGGREVDPVNAARIVEEIARGDASAGWCVMLAAQSCGFAGLHAQGRLARDLGRRRHRRGHGAPDRQGGCHRGRLRRLGPLALRLGQQPRHLVRRRVQDLRRRGATPRRRGQRAHEDAFRARRRGHRARHLGHPGPARHRQQRLQHRARLRAGDAGLPGPGRPAAARLGPLPRRAAGVHQPRRHAIGVARGAIDTAVETAASKVGWGGVMLKDTPRLQSAIAEAAGMVGAASNYLYESSWALWEEALAGQTGKADRAPACASRPATPCAPASRPSTCCTPPSRPRRSCPPSPLSRQLRDIHTASAHVMIGTMTFEAAGRALMGMDPQFPFF